MGMSNAMRRLPFWERVDIQTIIKDDCHLFIGARDSNGYGRIADNRFGPSNNKLIRLHRAMFEKHFGEIPKDKEVCHTCDVPNCINIKHLFLGTHKENMQDMWKKGRAENLKLWGNKHTKGMSINVGSKHGLSKLDEDKVKTIRQSIIAGEKKITLAEKFGVTEGCIRSIGRGASWKHVN